MRSSAARADTLTVGTGPAPLAGTFEEKHRMAANIDRMAYSRAGGVPWHGLGASVADGQPRDLDSMLAAANLANYRVSLTELWTYTRDGRTVGVPTHRAVFREDTGQTLGVVTDSYTPLQMRDGGAWLESLQQDGRLDIQTLGTLGKGERWWILAEVPEGTRTIAGDLFKSYMLIDGGHDGSHAVNTRSTSVRVVCQNTLNAANAAEKDASTFRFIHTTNIAQRMEQAASALQFVTVQQQRLAEFLEHAATVPVTSDVCERLGATLFGPVDERGTRVKNNVARFASIVREERRATGELTAYTLVNGITGYADHARTVTIPRTLEQREKRFESSFDGGGAAFKATGLAFIRELVGA